MKFDIKNRWSGEVMFSAEISCDENALPGVKLGLAVRAAVKDRANLNRANLGGASLDGASLDGASNLTEEQKASALVIDPSEIPVIPQIDAKILAAIEQGGELNMDHWHYCDSTHCRSGWAIHLAGPAGYALEEKVGAQMAGALIYRASRPGQPAPWFFAGNDEALADIKKCADEQIAAAQNQEAAN